MSRFVTLAYRQEVILKNQEMYHSRIMFLTHEYNAHIQ